MGEMVGRKPHDATNKRRKEHPQRPYAKETLQMRNKDWGKHDTNLLGILKRKDDNYKTEHCGNIAREYIACYIHGHEPQRKAVRAIIKLRDNRAET